MNNENDFRKLFSDYFIYLLSFTALYFIAAPIRHYLIRPEDPAVFGRTGLILLFGAVLGYFSHVNGVSSKEMIPLSGLNRWIFMILFYTGVFFLFISIS